MGGGPHIGHFSTDSLVSSVAHGPAIKYARVWWISWFSSVCYVHQTYFFSWIKCCCGPHSLNIPWRFMDTHTPSFNPLIESSYSLRTWSCVWILLLHHHISLHLARTPDIVRAHFYQFHWLISVVASELACIPDTRRSMALSFKSTERIIHFHSESSLERQNIFSLPLFHSLTQFQVHGYHPVYLGIAG